MYRWTYSRLISDSYPSRIKWIKNEHGQPRDDNVPAALHLPVGEVECLRRHRPSTIINISIILLEGEREY